MGQIKDKGEDTQQGDIYALYYQQRIPGNPVWVGEKVGQTETKSVEGLDGNVLFWGGGSFGVTLLGHSFKCANKFHQQDYTANQDFKNRRTIESQPVDAGKGQEE